MSEPIFILGCHRSGTSVVAGLLNRACGVSMGELMPPTDDNPMGYFEALGVVDAHRGILAQMERDWTCPPTNFRPGLFDLSALEEQVKIHTDLPGVWAMKDPRSMFLFPAWTHLGVDRVRLVAVVRPPADTVRSIEKRDHIRQDRAEAIVDAYLRRLLEIAEKVPLPIVQFPGEGDSLIRQVQDLAASLDLLWDEEVARELFDEKLVRNQSPLRDLSPTYERLVAKARFPEKVPPINLRSLKLTSEPEWPLETHIGVRYSQHRNQLWEMAHFSTDPNPHIAEVLMEGARRGGPNRPNVRLSQVEVTTPLAVGATLMRDVGRTHGVIAHGVLGGRSASEVEFFFRSVYINTDPLAELLVDVPDPQGSGLLNTTPPPQDHPRPARVQEIATQSGWEHIATERLSPGRSGMFFRKKVLTDTELVPVVTDLISSLHRIRAMEDRLASTLGRLEQDRIEISPSRDPFPEPVPGSIEAERSRADRAERELESLRSRRSVKMALALARPARGIFRAVRSWKKSH